MLISRGARTGARVRTTGMGPRRAQAAATELARDSVGAGAAGAMVASGSSGAGALLVAGFCGGLDESSVPGEVIVADEVYAASDEGHAAQSVPCELRDELLMALTGRGLKVRSGRIVCVSRLALGERRAQLLADGAIAVDMESVWLAAGASGRPFGVARVVLDSPRHELMRAGAVLGVLRAGRALGAVARALGDISLERASLAGQPADASINDGAHGG
jgi:4-hydroxy-3-methylbut-2-enyl diphosphate reductase